MNLSAGILLIVGLGLNSPAEAVQVEQQHDGLPPHLQQDPGQPEQLIAGSPRSAGGAARVHPVILVPGDGGSQIEAKLNKTEVDFSFREIVIISLRPRKGKKLQIQENMFSSGGPLLVQQD